MTRSSQKFSCGCTQASKSIKFLPLRNQGFEICPVVNQFFGDNLKNIHFRAYVASQVIYKCDLCGYFGVFKKSLRPSGAEIVFLAGGAKGRGRIGTFPTPGRLSPGRYRFYTP